MKRIGLALVALALGTMPAPTRAATPQRTSVETPGEASSKAGPAAGDDGMMSFGGGVWLVDEPSDDLAEPLPLASKREFEQRGYEVVQTGDKVQAVVDKQGKIYNKRPYHGIIPGRRDVFLPGRWARLAKRDYVTWVGVQPMASITRVFWQLTDPAPRFEVTKVDDRTLQVFFPGGRVPTRNNRRALRMAKFGGPVASVVTKRARGGALYVVHLKAAANHLYRFEAPFLYLDFERQ